MKIALCGKGGCGKSSLTALIAGMLAGKGWRVLVIDADESNTGLYRLLGVEQPVNLLDHLGGKKEFKKNLNNTFPPPVGAVFGETLKTDDLPAECVAQTGSLKLLSVGKIHQAGEGCACSLGLLSKMVLSKLDLADDEIVLIDTEAGVEHFGRGVDAGCDMILCVVDPVFESFLLAQKIDQMAKETDAELFYILNRSDSRTETVAQQHIDEKRIIAKIPYSEEMFAASLQGAPLHVDIAEIEPVAELIKNRSGRSSQ